MTEFRFHITRVSSNKKVGPIPVTTSSENTCPITCPLYQKGCYAKAGPLALHWRKVSDRDEKRSLSAADFLQAVTSLPRGQLWRHNQAGDIPAQGGYIDGAFLADLVRANKAKRGFTYTHHILNSHNIEQIREANRKGFIINHSANTINEAVNTYKNVKGMPVVTILPIEAPNVQTIEGVKVVACPAEKSEKITCANCALCADPKRDYVIGFRAHGTSKRHANIIAQG